MGMHTHFDQGTPLYIKLKDGTIIEGKFKDHKSGCVILADGQRIDLKKVQSMSIRKLKTEVKENRNIQFRKS